jgi:MFS family permease
VGTKGRGGRKRDTLHTHARGLASARYQGWHCAGAPGLVRITRFQETAEARAVSPMHHRKQVGDQRALLPLSRKVQSIDEIIVLAGGFGAHQRMQAALCAGWFAIAGAATFLPNFLFPRLSASGWSEALTDSEMAKLNALFFAGNTVGLLGWGAFGDSRGRRPAALVTLALLIIASALTFASGGLASLTLARTFAGVAAGGLTAPFLLLLEQVPPAERLFAKVVLSVCGWTLGTLWLTGVAYALRDVEYEGVSWRVLVLHLLPAPGLLAACCLGLRESPRFLLTRGTKTAASDALHNLRAVAKTNGKLLPEEMVVAPLAVGGGGGSGRSLSGCERTMELLHPSLLRQSLLVGVGCFGSMCVYYGVALSPTHSVGHTDLYMHNALGCVSELPATFLMAKLGDRFGRTRTWAGFLFLGAASLIALAAFEAPPDAAPSSSPLSPPGGGVADGHWNATLDGSIGLVGADPHSSQASALHHAHHVVHRHHQAWQGRALGAHGGRAPPPPGGPGSLLLAISLLARFGVAGAAGICYVAAAEQFPTTSRAAATAAAAALGRVGSIVAPLLRLTGMPTLLMATIGFVAALAVLRLPETAGTELPETIHQAASTKGDADDEGIMLVDQPLGRAQEDQEGNAG